MKLHEYRQLTLLAFLLLADLAFLPLSAVSRIPARVSAGPLQHAGERLHSHAEESRQEEDSSHEHGSAEERQAL